MSVLSKPTSTPPKFKVGTNVPYGHHTVKVIEFCPTASGLPYYKIELKGGARFKVAESHLG